MREVLKTYQERLINLNGRNRSLVLRKIYKKRSFDLAKPLAEKCYKEADLLAYLLTRTKKAFTLIEDPFKLRVKALKKLKDQTEKDQEEEIEALKAKVAELYPLAEKEMQVMIRREEEINEKYALYIKDEKERIEASTEKLIRYANQIKYLAREIKAVEKETGKYELFVGYPFVEGRFNDGTFVRGPLLLFPVEVIKRNNTWAIKNIVTQDILLNKVLLYGYAKYSEIKLGEIETEFNHLEQFGEDPIQGVITYINDHKLVTDKPSSLKVIGLKAYTNATIPTYKSGELIIKPYNVLGQFPLSNAIYTDYQALGEEEVTQELLEALLLNKEDLEKVQALKKEKEVDKTVASEHDMFFFTSLDYSQENAVNKLKEVNKLVIYGPPGTGKSHTIANIITDGLCKGKRILMVSQKRAALDVIYNRLADIKSKMVLIHDANRDKKDFYIKVVDALKKDALEYDMYSEIKRDEVATQIDEKIIGLEKIAEMLMQEQAFGLSLQEMYIRTQGIFETTDARFKFYKAFRRNNIFEAYHYQELEKAFEVVTKDALMIRWFIQYRKMCDTNSYMTAYPHKIDVMAHEDIIDATTILQKLVDQEQDLDVEAYTAFAGYYYPNKDQVTEKGCLDAARAFTHSRHNDLLDEETVHWWEVGKSFKKLSKSKEIKANMTIYKEKEISYIKLFEGYQEQVAIGRKALESIKSNLTQDHFNKLEASLIQKFLIGEELNTLINALDAQNDFSPLRLKWENLTPLEGKLLDYAYDLVEIKEEMAEVLEHLLEYIILEQISQIEKSEAFNAFYLYFNLYTETVDEVTKLMGMKNAITQEMVRNRWNDQFQVFLDTSTFKEFKRQAEKKRQLWPIRKYIIEFSEMLLTLFPCWLLSPETVSNIFPLQEGLFDIIIFDEASQIFVENAVPTIYRGKSVVIAGDDQQLQPTSIFSSKYDEFEEEALTLETVAAFEEESLLDLAKVNYDSVHLNHHYRSKYEELINFSNYAFYNGQLNISPNIKHTKALAKPPIERIMVEGVWEDRKNREEASRVVELVAEILATRNKDETIGVITFNITQKDLIEDLLEARVNYDSAFKKAYQAEKDRYDGNEDVSIFVKNIENVQGDERDIIIFSVGYAKNPEGKVSINFGSLSQSGGENRLNVAISRAKRKIYVVTSIEPEALKVGKTLNRGPKLFKQYLAYVRAISNRDEMDAQRQLTLLSEVKEKKVEKEDLFVRAIAKALEAKGHKVMINIGSSQSKIDLALLHPETEAFVLGIECDGQAYRNRPSVRERDIHRKRFLELRGWEMMRVWSVDWWKDREKLIEKIEHFFEILMASEEVSQQVEMTTAEEGRLDIDISENGVGYGDRVWIKDTMSKEIFDVDLRDNKSSKGVLNPFKQFLLGKEKGSVFTYEAYEYQIVKIKKRKR